MSKDLKKDVMIPATYVDWHCRKCGYIHETTIPSNWNPLVCPVCESREIQRGHPVLPVNKAWCDSSPMRYDFCSEKKEIQVYLRAATGERAGKVMNPDYVPDCNDDPIEVARAVLEIVNTKYIYCGENDRIVSVLAAMEDCKDMSDLNRAANLLHELREQIVRGVTKYNDLLNDYKSNVAISNK